jgi:uncharacterized cupin superfamily protein
MQHVDIDDVEPRGPGGGAVDRRGLAEPLGATNLALNRSVLEPGESFAGGMHAPLDQEEVFYVLSGTATSSRS